MTVHFIGAGPGAPDLLTLRGRDLIAAADVVIYAGSLVPAAVVAHARADALVIDSADMTLDRLVACMSEAHEAGRSVARVHSGDPSLYGAIGEQIRRLPSSGSTTTSPRGSRPTPPPPPPSARSSPCPASARPWC